MKKLILIFFIGVGLATSVLGQTKELTIEDAVIGQWRHLYPEYLVNPAWQDNNGNFAYVSEYRELKQGSVDQPEGETLVSLAELNDALTEVGIEERSYFVYDFEWLSPETIGFTTDNNYVIFNVKQKSIELKIKYDGDGENVAFCKENNQVAYTVENNLYVANESSDATPVTTYDDPNMVCGQSVSRNEFGIDGGIFWSPKGKYLAFFRKDESDVTNFPLVDITTRIAEVDNTKYPMAGTNSEHVAVGVYNMDSGKTVYIEDNPESEQYLTCVTWGPEEQYVYIAVLNREQNHMKLNQYNATNGKLVKTLFEEEHEKYVEPEHDLIFLPDNPNEFLWQSERDGYNHLYHYNTDGEMLQQLTKGQWVVTGTHGFTDDSKTFYYTSTAISPLENHLYKVSLKNGKSTQITSETGTHELTISNDGNYILDEYTSRQTPRIVNILDSKGKVEANVLTAENPLDDYKLGKMKIGTITAGDGETDLYYRLITPPDFDPNKRYPAIVYVYGGPHAQLITESWLGGVSMWQYYMAQKGYVMLTVDNRGSANRGFEFENVIHRQCGVAEMDDQMKGIELLESLGYVDMDRIGVHGWSYGGFMTISLMVNHPDIFKVGAAGGPVIDWKYYEVMYGERYMDTPNENPEGYETTSLLNKAENLQGQLLIAQGGIDPTVVWQNSLQFIQKCIENEIITVDYFPYPRHEHNVRGTDRIHLMRKVTKYFEDYL